MAVATLTDANFIQHVQPQTNIPIVFSAVERLGNSLRPPLSWLGVSAVASTVGFRPQLNALATIVAAMRLKAFMSCRGCYCNSMKNGK